MSTTDFGVPTDDSGYDIDQAADAFSKLWEPKKDAEKPSDKDDQADDEEDTEDTEGSDKDAETEDEAEGDDESTEGDDEDGDEDETNDSNVEVKDDFKVKVKVGDQEIEKSIGDLKRLAGQEAALTQKSQKVASDRKQLDTQAATHVAALKVLLDKAAEKYAPYEKLNFLALAKDPNISAEEIDALQTAAREAFEHKRFLEQEMGTFSQKLQEQRAKEIREQAAETVKVLSDPETGIKGFNQKLYEDMVSYAKTQGVTDDAISELVDPISFRILHKAMLYDAGVKTVKEANDPKAEKGKKKGKAPKKIVKSLGNSETNKEVLKGDKSKDAMKRLEKSGKVDDAASAFMARWSDA